MGSRRSFAVSNVLICGLVVSMWFSEKSLFTIYFFITQNFGKRKKKKSKIARLNLKNITSAQNQKRQNTFHELWIQLVSNIHSEPFSQFLFCETNSKMIDTVTDDGAASQTNISCPHICKKKRNFLNFYPRLKSAEAFTMNTALLSSNSTNSLMKSVRKTSALKFQPHWMIFPMKLSGFIPFIIIIRNFSK